MCFVTPLSAEANRGNPEVRIVSSEFQRTLFNEK